MNEEQLHLYSGVRVRIPEGLRLRTMTCPTDQRRLNDLIEIEAWREPRQRGSHLYRVRFRRLDLLEDPVRSAEFAAWKIREAFKLPPLDFHKGRFGW